MTPHPSSRLTSYAYPYSTPLEPWLVGTLKKMGIIPKEDEEQSEESSDDDSDDSDDSADEDKPKIKRGLGSTPEDSLALEKMAGAKRVDTSAIVGRPDTAASTASSLNPGMIMICTPLSYLTASNHY